MDDINVALGYPSVSQPLVRPMKPPKFPLKFKEFLRRAFGGTRHMERLHLFRKYLLNMYSQIEELKHLSPEAREAEAIVRRDKLIATYNQEGVHEIPFGYFMERIPAWREHSHVAQRQAAAQSRWEKEKQKKILALPKTAESALSQDEKRSLASKKNKKV